MGKANDLTRVMASFAMFIFSFLAYQPLALEIDEYATNATLTNAIWNLLDAVFPLFWTIFVVFWLCLAIWFILEGF